MTFKETSVDFGKMKKGEKRSHVFEFTNTGDEDLIIELVSACHCTTLEWPEGEVFKPGTGGLIKATFDSTEYEGAINKTIDILLEHTDPTTGYQVIIELRYLAIVE